MRAAEKGTQALADAYRAAADVGLSSNDVDWPNLFVHRVADLQRAEEKAAEGSVVGEDSDPDQYDDHFAPVTRLLSAAFQRLTDLNLGYARVLCGGWSLQKGDSFCVWLPLPDGTHEF